MTEQHTDLSFEAYGARIGLRVRAPIVDELEGLIPPTAVRIPVEHASTVFTLTGKSGSGPGDPPTYHLARDDKRLGYSRDLAKAWRFLSSRLHFEVARRAQDWVFVHAGVVHVDGGAIALPGRSLAGKSTLVRALVAAGADYFSDEYAVLDQDGLVHPYLKPLSERRVGALPELHHPDTLGSPERAEAGPVPLAVTVVTRFQPGAEWSFRRISGGESLMALLNNTVVVRERPAPALEVLVKAVGDSSGLEATRGEAGQAAAALLREVREMQKPPGTG